jgi:hypothetical protein
MSRRAGDGDDWKWGARGVSARMMGLTVFGLLLHRHFAFRCALAAHPHPDRDGAGEQHRDDVRRDEPNRNRDRERQRGLELYDRDVAERRS